MPFKKISLISIVFTLFFSLSTLSNAQMTLVPNYIGSVSGIPAGQRFRNDINNHLSGVSPISPSLATVIKTANYSIPSSGVSGVVCNASGTIAVTLPPATGSNLDLWVKNWTTNLCNITPNGTDTIDGSNSALGLGTQWDARHLRDTATGKWSVVDEIATGGGGGSDFPATTNLSMNSHKLTSVAVNTATGDALSQAQSHLNDLATATGNYAMGTNKITGLAVNTATGDALSQAQSHLNDLATATANYSLGTHRLTSVAVNTTTADALSQGQSHLNDLATATGNYAMGTNKITGLAAATTSGDALSKAQSVLNDLTTATGNYNMGANKVTNNAVGISSGDTMVFGLNHINDLAAATANYSMGTNYKITALAANTTSGDALSQAQSHLNDLAIATGNYAMGTNKITGLAAATTSGDAIGYGQSGAQLTVNQNTTSVISTGTVASAGSTPAVVTAPTNIVAGNALVLVIMAPNSPTFTFPSGFAQILATTISGVTLATACKTATGGEPGTYSTSFTGGSSGGRAYITQIAGTDCSHIDASLGASSAFPTLPTVAGLSTSTTNDLILAVGSFSCGDVPNLNTGTIFYNNNSVDALVGSWRIQPSVGTTTAATIGQTTASCGGGAAVIGQQIAFKPIATVQSGAVVGDQSNVRLGSLNASISNVINVTAAPYFAQNDSNTDDYPVIQQAIYDCDGAVPPTFPTTKGCKIYLPRSSVGKCYAISKPLRAVAGIIEIAGDTGSCIQKLYNGPTIIAQGWNTDHLDLTGPALVGSGNSFSTLSCSGTGCATLGETDFGELMNTSQYNLATAFATGFDVEFWMEATSASAGNVIGWEPSRPGPNSFGMFRFNYSSGRQVNVTVDTKPTGVRTITDAVENGTTTLISATASFVAGDVGRQVFGEGIAATTVTVASVTNSTTIVMSTAATQTSAGNIVTLGGIVVSLSACPAQTLSTAYDMALDWDGTTYRLFQGGTVCSTATSSDPPYLNPYEGLLFPDLGHLDYYMGGGGVSATFMGYLDELRFYTASLHTSTYTPPTSRFPTTDDGHTTFLLDGSAANADGTQSIYRFGRTMYVPIVNGASGGPALHLHNIELCADDTNPFHRGDGLFAQWSQGMEVDHVSCSGAVYAGLDFYNNDYSSYEHDNTVLGGLIGIHHGIAWNGSLAQNDIMDNQQIACEMTVGDGGGSFHDIHEGCVNRGGLHYCKMYLGEGFAGIADFDGCDQEAGDPNFLGTILIDSPSVPLQFNAPILTVVSGKPLVRITGTAGSGPTFINAQIYGSGASEIVHQTVLPTTPTVLINPIYQSSIPLSNWTGDPGVQVCTKGTCSHPLLILGTKATSFDVNWAAQDNVSAVLGASSLAITFKNPLKNSFQYLTLCQDATGSRTGTTFVVGTGISGSLKWAGGSAPTLTTTLNKCDRMKFSFDGADLVGALEVANF